MAMLEQMGKLNDDSVPLMNPDNLSSYITRNWHVENKQNLDTNLHSSAFRWPAIVSLLWSMNCQKK